MIEPLITEQKSEDGKVVGVRFKNDLVEDEYEGLKESLKKLSPTKAYFRDETGRYSQSNNIKKLLEINFSDEDQSETSKE